MVWILDIKDDGLVPNWSASNAHVGLRLRFVLEHLDEMLSVFQVLRIHDVHLQLGITAYSHLCHELPFSLLGLSELEFYFFLLARMVDYISHNFFLPLN